MRNNKGQACYVLSIVLVPLTMALGAFAADSMHCVSARNELQAACDAGALAGAYKLGQNTTTAATNAATTVTLNNNVEREAVSSSSANTTVSVQVTAPTSTTTGSVTVSATRKIKLMFSCLFGHAFEKVAASATAGGANKLSQLPIGKAFPIALSIDAVGAYTTRPLSALGIGQPIIIDLGAPTKDAIACSTGFGSTANTKYFRDAMDESLGVNPVATPAVVPSVGVGDAISLNNGNGGFGDMLGDPEYSKLLNQTIILPLIQGGAPFNQTRPVIGFVALKITSMVKVTGAPLITATIVKTAVRGQSSGPAYTGAYAAQTANLSPSVVHLIR